MRHIVCTPDTCGGSPRIEDTRLTCGNVVLDLTIGKVSLAAFLTTYSYLSKEDVNTVAEYCSSRQCIRDRPNNYCTGCSLDKREEIPPKVFIENADDWAAFARNPNIGPAFLGSKAEYNESEKPIDIWKLAAELKDKMDMLK